MTRLASAPESLAELFQDEEIAAGDAAIDDVLARAGGDPRAAVRALLTELGEQDHARRAADAATSFGYRRGLQPMRPTRGA